MEPEPEPEPEFPVGFRCEWGIVLTSLAPWGSLPPPLLVFYNCLPDGQTIGLGMGPSVALTG